MGEINPGADKKSDCSRYDGEGEWGRERMERVISQYIEGGRESAERQRPGRGEWVERQQRYAEHVSDHRIWTEPNIETTRAQCGSCVPTLSERVRSGGRRGGGGEAVVEISTRDMR